jgi:TolA-binding protein
MNRFEKTAAVLTALAAVSGVMTPTVAAAGGNPFQAVQQRTCDTHAAALRNLDAANKRLAQARAQLAAANGDATAMATAQLVVTDAQNSVNAANEQVRIAARNYAIATGGVKSQGLPSVCTI